MPGIFLKAVLAAENAWIYIYFEVSCMIYMYIYTPRGFAGFAGHGWLAMLLVLLRRMHVGWWNKNSVRFKRKTGRQAQADRRTH